MHEVEAALSERAMTALERLSMLSGVTVEDLVVRIAGQGAAHDAETIRMTDDAVASAMARMRTGQPGNPGEPRI